MRRLVIAAMLLVTAGQAAAQQEQGKEYAAVAAAWKALNNGRVTAADAIVRARAFDTAGKPIPGAAYDQWAQLRAVATNAAGHKVNAPGVTAGKVDEVDPGLARIDAATPRDAIAVIAERAKATRIVILNEDHGSPRNRGFALEVARALRPLGYTMLGAETFSTDPDLARRAVDMSKLKREGYPRQYTGYYTTEPAFGDFIRQALALGYTPFAYEEAGPEQPGDEQTQIARRETAQADNIARVLAENPRAKLFVYVGWHHATEQPIRYPDPSRFTAWMATRLKARTGIDPVTIDQTVLNDGPTGEAALVAAAAGKLGGRPGVLFEGDRPLVLRRFAGAVDLQVAHPPSRLVGGRPDWLARMGRKPTPVPARYLPATGTRLVQAFVASEAEDAIPVDQVLVTAGETPPMLMLPAAPVRYAVQDAP